MKLLLALAALLVSGCATKVIETDRLAVIEEINKSSARIVSKKAADDGSRAGGVVSFYSEAESPIARAAAELYCEGPVKVRSEELGTTGTVHGSAFASGNFAVGSSQAERAWFMAFDCNKAPTEAEVAAYREKFTKKHSYRQGAGDGLMGALGL